jgi:release factor glutamine methyltransferase
MSDNGTLSWRDLINEATTRLNLSLQGSREQEARWIVERVSGYDSSQLRLNESELVSTRAVGFFDGLLQRRANGEPLQYVLGRWSFRSLELLVDQNVLIPRPETEMVAGLAIVAARAAAFARGLPGSATVVDLGTGSGAIALSVASEVPHATVYATDVSAAALAVARANLAGLGRAATRVTLHEGSWFDALPNSLVGRIDVLVSNPPYVGEHESLPDEVRAWEPHLALYAGDDGTRDLRVLIPQAIGWLVSAGELIIEMAPDQTAWAADLARASGFIRVRIEKDLAGKPRALVAARP